MTEDGRRKTDDGIENQKSKIENPKWRASVLNVVLMVLLATVCVSVGETALSLGMKTVQNGDRHGFGFLLAAVTNPYVLGGTLLMMVYFGLYARALSLADISFVLPFTALSYLFVALLARYWLHEAVSPTRWVGALIIVLGVLVVGLGERR